MEQVIVSDDFKIEIPNSIRTKTKIHPGQSLYLINEQGTIKILFSDKIHNFFGIAKGINSDFERDEEDRV